MGLSWLAYIMTRPRAVRVCTACHERKVRCDFDTRDRPCLNCRERYIECKVRTRKAYCGTKRKRNISKATDVNGAIDGEASVEIDPSTYLSRLVDQPGTRLTTVFVGEGGYGFITDILESSTTKPRYVTIHGSIDLPLPAEDLKFLKFKGCFDLPPESDDLIMSYFRYIHPIFPILDARAFLKQYSEMGLESINLLLLWSMFSVSATHVPECSSRETKASYMLRGKLLFDLSGEADKAVLVQSAMLLSFWFDNIEDVKQSWYWSSIAFSTIQTLGLHRRTPSKSWDGKAWFYIWDCCVLRDAWLSSSMGRPLRLLEASIDDVRDSSSDNAFKGLVIRGQQIFSDEQANSLDDMWGDAMSIALNLRENISAQSTAPVKPLATRTSFQISHLSPTDPLSLCYRHLRLCHSAAVISTCKIGDGSLLDPKYLTTGLEIKSIVASYLDDCPSIFAPPMIAPLTMPGALVALSMLQSTDVNLQSQGSQMMKLIITFLGSIEKSYPAANITKRIYTAVCDNMPGRKTSSPQ